MIGRDPIFHLMSGDSKTGIYMGYHRHIFLTTVDNNCDMNDRSTPH